MKNRLIVLLFIFPADVFAKESGPQADNAQFQKCMSAFEYVYRERPYDKLKLSRETCSKIGELNQAQRRNLYACTELHHAWDIVSAEARAINRCLTLLDKFNFVDLNLFYCVSNQHSRYGIPATDYSEKIKVIDECLESR